MGALSDFIDKYNSVIQETCNKYNIFPSVLLTQAGMETTWGTAPRSSATSGCNNVFGIMYSNAAAHDPNLTTSSGLNGFTQYNSFDDSIKDYGYFITHNSRYSDCFKKSTPAEVLSAIADAGYCADPPPATYKQYLLNMLTSNNLTQYDNNYNPNNTPINNSNSDSNPNGDITIKWNIGWNMDNIGWFYVTDNTPGKEVFYTAKDGWKKIDDVWYLFDDRGYAYQNKWYQDSNGDWFVFDNNCHLVTDSWVLTCKNNKWYRVNSGGYMIHDTWFTYNDKKYYLGNNGQMYSNEWLKDNNIWHYFNENGTMAIEQWVLHGKDYYYIDSNGYMLKNTTREIDGLEYTFDEYGKSNKKYVEA